MHKANRLLLACSMLFCGFSTVSWGQSQHDFDGDGTPDTVESIPGFHPDNPIVGVVRVRSGVDGAVLLEVHGPQANDAFGLAAEAIGDFDGDGVPDIAVAAPRAFLTSDRVGRVYIHSGADGRVLRTLVGRRGDRLGFDVRVMRDLNLDGTPDLTVYGMALDTRGFPVDRTFVYSGVTGELLFDQTYPIRGLTEALVEPIEAWGDLNGTLSLDNGDLVEMLGLIGDGAGPESGGDLNRDDAVDMADFLTLVDALAAGEPPVAETDYVLEQWEWDSLRSTMDAWTWLYPEDAISATTDPEGWRGQQGSHAWWVQGRLRSDGKRLVSGWLETPGELAVGRQGQRASSVGGGGGIGGGPPCAACVTIVQCPESVRLGEDFTVCAQTCNVCHGPLEWRVWEGVFEALPPPPGDCVDWVVDFVEMLPIDAVFTVYCYNYNSNGDLICTRTDSCTVIVEDCILELEGCPVELREGESGTLTAIPDPEGGVYTWSILEGGEFLEFFGSVGNTATFEVKDGISCHPPPVDVTIKVRYEKDGCIKEKVCTFEVVIDCDDDGLDDRDESEPGSGNCPYWGIWDSDEDCVSDGDEVNIWGTDPCNPDSDGDGVPDGVEIKLLLLGADYWHPMVYNAEPWHDTDHDGLTDLQEVGSPCNSTPLTHPLLWDTDSDGIWDGCEVANGWDPNNPNSPTPGGDNFDYDNDGLPDAQELCTGCTDPTNPDTDGDGLLDGDESYYFTNTSPCDPDRDNDGLLDGEEINVYGTDPANDDTDGDGMPDGWEVAHGFDPLDPNDGALDADGDGLSNAEEYRWGTDPGNRDSDGDGVEDSEEVAQGSDPASAESSAPGDGVPVRLTISNPGGHAKWTLSVGGKRTPTFEDYGQAPPPVTYYFAPGKTYTITVSYGGDNLETCPSTRDYSYCASVSVLEGHHGVVVDENEADPNGNYCQQQTNLLGCKNGSGVPCNPAAGKHAMLYLPLIDLDIDSDNDEGFGIPGRLYAEDQIEDSEGEPGKLITINNGDSDGDGIPDFADGYDLDPLVEDDDETPGERFVPMVLDIRALADPENARVTFSYSGSDPALVVVHDDPEGIAPPLYIAAPGALRLWMKDGDQPRSAQVVPAGDYIAPGQQYTLGDLGLGPDGGAVTLYCEAVDTSGAAGELRIEASVEGEAAPDAVRLSAFGTRFVEVRPDGSLLPVSHPQVSEPSPTIVLTDWAVTNVRVSDDFSRLLADIYLVGEVDDAASDLIPGPEGVIEHLNLRLNGTPIDADGRPVYDGDPTPPITIPVLFTKAQQPTGLLKPYDFAGTFNAVLVGVEVAPGVNSVGLYASNIYGFTGFAEGGFAIGFEPPQDPEFGAIDLWLDFNGAEPYSTDPEESVPAQYAVHGQVYDTVLLPDLVEPGLWSDIDETMVVRVLPGAVFTVDEADLWELEVSTPDGRLVEDRIWHVETDLDTREFVARRVFEDYERPDWEGFTVFLASMEPAEAWRRSEGGTFRPVLIQVIGPPEVRAMLESVQLGESDFYYPVEYEGETFLANEESLVFEMPRPLLVLPANLLDEQPEPGDEPDPRDGLWNFAKGFGAGIADTGTSLWDGVKWIGRRAWYQVRHYNAISATYRVFTSGHYVTVEDRQAIGAAMDLGGQLAEFAWMVLEDQQAFIEAVLLNDVEELNRLGEKYSLVLQFSVEILEALKEDLLNLDDFTKGRIVGRVVGEVGVMVVETAATGGAAAALKGATIIGVLPKLRQAKYIQNLPAVMAKLDDAGDLAVYAASLRRYNGAEEAYSMFLWIKRRDNVKGFDAFDRLLVASNTAAGRKVVDSNLIYVARAVMNDVYETAAENSTLVPSVSQMDGFLRGGQHAARFIDSGLEVHHTVPEYLLEMLIRDRYPDWNDGQVLELFNTLRHEMPGYIVHRVDHTGAGEGLASFHSILATEGQGGLWRGNQYIHRTYDTGQIITGLDRTYTLWERSEVWVIAKDWLRRKGFSID